MSNILKNIDELVALSDIIKYVSNHTLSKSYIDEVLKFLIPSDNGQSLIDYHITEKGMTTAIFDSQCMCIRGSLNKINIWLDETLKDFENEIKDANILKSYLFLFLITHEIEHSYQCLIGKEVINAPSKIIQCGYQGIFDLFFKKEYIIPRPIKETRKLISLILYKRNENFFVL